MSLERNIPRPFEASFDAGIPGGSLSHAQEYTTIQQQLEAIQYQPGCEQKLDYHLLHLKRRVLESRESASQQERVSTINGLLARSQFDVASYIKDDKSEIARSIQNLNLAFTAFAFSSLHPVYQETAIRNYNKLQKAQVAATGEPLRDVELTNDLAGTLSWLLDQANIPHSFDSSAVCIPFAPLEQTMRTADLTPLVRPLSNDIARIDHEVRTPTHGLMEVWKQQNQE
jgi:hypothetical protein